MSSYLIYGGVIHTMSSFGTVEAMLVVGEKVLRVGTVDAVRAAAPRGAVHVDLKGRSLVPGFHDSHIHFLWYAMNMKRVDLRGVATLGEALPIIRKAVEKAEPGTWVEGAGWDRSLWVDFPTRHDLDAFSKDIPVALSSKDGHSIWVNSKTLELANITASTEAPAGGAILREASGEPTGILQDAAISLVNKVIPDPTPEFMYEAAADCVPHLWSMGLTCIHAPEGLELFGIARKLRLEKDIPFRVALMPPVEVLRRLDDLGLRQGYGDDWVWMAQVKMFKDGALGSSTAHLYEPYEHLPGYCGLEIMTNDEAKENVRRSIEAGYGVAIHAIGDRAVSDTLDAIEANIPESRRRGLRHRIEHAQMVHPKDIARFRELGVIASVQPAHAVADRDMADREWGARSSRAYPFGQLKTAGASFAFGSDGPVDTPDPIYGIYCAVNRHAPGEPPDRSWHPSERLSVADALSAYTREAAYAVGKEYVLGDLSPGKYADFAVLSEDIMRVAPQDISTVRVEATAIGGRFVVEPRW